MASILMNTEMTVLREDPYRLIDIYYGCFGPTAVRSDLAEYILRCLGSPHASRSTVLDLGCGTGCITIPMARSCGTVVGLDNNQMAIDLTRERKHAHQARNVSVMHADWTRLVDVVERGSLDGVVCWGNSLGYTTSWLMPDIDVSSSDRKIAVTLRGVHRVLKDGGAFVLQVEDSDRAILQGIVREWKIKDGATLHHMVWSIGYQPNGVRINRATRFVCSVGGDIRETHEMEFVGRAMRPASLISTMREIGFQDVQLVADASDSDSVILMARK